MNVLVYDVAASSGGALSVLKDYYNSYVANSDGNHYYFVISTPELASTANITILRYPWIKKSWFHRLWFDYVVAPELVKKLKIDTVFFAAKYFVATYRNTSNSVFASGTSFCKI